MTTVIYSLPKSGSKMLCSLLASHPAQLKVQHEFCGTPDELRNLDVALIHLHELPPWLREFECTRIHWIRRDHRAAAISSLLDGYRFPQRGYELPEWVVSDTAEARRQAHDLAERLVPFDATFYYEDLTGDKSIKYLHFTPRRALLKVLGVPDAPLKTAYRKETKLPANYECLRAG